jgi:hypothetical protein
MARIYLARHVRHDRHIVLKLLNLELGTAVCVVRRCVLVVRCV